MTFRTLREAAEEAGASAVWYESRRPGLGGDFFIELKLAFQTIRRNPRSLPRLEGYTGPHEIRRVLMRRFPYAIIFQCRPNESLVVAVAHLRRRPLYWLNRLE